MKRQVNKLKTIKFKNKNYSTFDELLGRDSCDTLISKVGNKKKNNNNNCLEHGCPTRMQ